jgi:hypothetical protein
MFGAGRRGARLFCIIGVCILCDGCGFLPGFSLFEEPVLYYLPVSEVANQVACELQEFRKEHEHDVYTSQRWVLANEDVAVKLNLQTDSSGYVNFTGINVSQVGLAAFQQFVLSATSGKTTIPTLAAKASAKRTKTVQINFSVSPAALDIHLFSTNPSDPKAKKQTINCQVWENSLANNPLNRLYLKDWLNNFFETVNAGTKQPQYANTDLSDTILNALRSLKPPDPVPSQFKIQSVELSTQIQLAADISGGATPNILGDGSVFILPINGLSFDYNPDYVHKIDFTLSLCDNRNSACYPPDVGAPPLTHLMKDQCHLYAKLAPLMSGIKQPKDATIKGVQYTCNKDGYYVPANNS